MPVRGKVTPFPSTNEAIPGRIIIMLLPFIKQIPARGGSWEREGIASRSPQTNVREGLGGTGTERLFEGKCMLARGPDAALRI